MVAVLCKKYGLSHIEFAEDVVSETFLKATEVWAAKGVPENPTGWLYVVAKRKVLQHFRREKVFEDKVSPELTLKRMQDQDLSEPDFSLQNIQDSQLQMFFAVCHPALASEAQIGLALRTLCGFGIDEIAEAFLATKATINKRLYRARKKLQEENVKMEMPSKNKIPDRLDNVLRIIYLLFNEGYYSKTQNQTLSKDLCLEAMRLGLILTRHEETNLPKTNALVALICFHSSRFDARQTNDSDLSGMILYDQQNTALWDKALIRQGMSFLERSASGKQISSYHLEARIAYWHCFKEDTQEKWEEILQLYNQLMEINYSPTVILNRIYALYKVKGTRAAIVEAEKLGFEENHFYYVLLGELYRENDVQKAKCHFQKALSLAKTKPEKQEIQKKINALD